MHLGDTRGGIYRYGTVLAAAMRLQPSVDVSERAVPITSRRSAGLRAVARASASLARSDATILQYSRHNIWVAGRLRLLQLALVHLVLRCRTVVVLHDVPTPGSVGRAEACALRLNLLMARAVVVHGAHERARLPRWPRGRVFTIPHFVEPRRLPEREYARGRFNVASGETILAMVGWIHPRKNYGAAVRALASLGARTRLWLIGTSPSGFEPYVEGLMRLADELGVREQIVVTGYVSEEELDARLSAVDIGLCPYVDVSASGSLATLIGANRPVVASDLPPFRDQQRHLGSLLQLVDQPTPERLVAGVRDVRSGFVFGAARTCQLRELSPEAISYRYLAAATHAAK
ncbi:MAG TPA: glycosyltransferase [Solirubrobacteraceae bacterium]